MTINMNTMKNISDSSHPVKKNAVPLIPSSQEHALVLFSWKSLKCNQMLGQKTMVTKEIGKEILLACYSSLNLSPWNINVHFKIKNLFTVTITLRNYSGLTRVGRGRVRSTLGAA